MIWTLKQCSEQQKDSPLHGLTGTLGNQTEKRDILQDGETVYKDYQDQACGIMKIVLIWGNFIVKLNVSKGTNGTLLKHPVWC